MKKHVRRCKSCNEWSDGQGRFCPNCGFEHDEQSNAERKEREEKGDHQVPIIKIYPDDHVWIKILKRPVQIVQLVLYAIIAFLVYLTTAFAH